MLAERIVLEVAVETVEDAQAAQLGGADRLELCATLDAGGLTPTATTFRIIRETISLPMVVMIRPRPGDFVYAPDELSQMADHIQRFVQLGADGIVFGTLTWDGRVDTDAAAELIRAAGLCEPVFHRAFDSIKHPDEALTELVQLGVRRVLTSGPHATAAESLPYLKWLTDRAAGRITIMPGGGIKPTNVLNVLAETGATQIHGRFSRNGRTDTATVSAVRQLVDQLRTTSDSS